MTAVLVATGCAAATSRIRKERKAMAIVRFDPFRDMLTLQERMNRLFDESFKTIGRSGSPEDWAAGSWSPSVDIYEQNGNIVLNAELPGVDAKDVDVRVENNVLTLRGERRLEGDVKRESYHRIERVYGSFSRSFTLPSVVDADKIKAEFKDGVLRMVLPKRDEAKPKQIAISVTHQ
jgi:HSP20 family protein